MKEKSATLLYISKHMPNAPVHFKARTSLSLQNSTSCTYQLDVHNQEQFVPQESSSTSIMTVLTRPYHLVNGSVWISVKTLPNGERVHHRRFAWRTCPSSKRKLLCSSSSYSPKWWRGSRDYFPVHLIEACSQEFDDEGQETRVCKCLLGSRVIHKVRSEKKRMEVYD